MLFIFLSSRLTELQNSNVQQSDTVEGELVRALARAGALSEDNAKDPVNKVTILYDILYASLHL